MRTVNFVFGLHNHQPVGNFESVFESSFQTAYAPFIDVLEKHPKIRMSLHYTGILFEWIAAKKPAFVKRIRKLAQRGQVEFQTGAYYEPILPIIPDHDKIAQIRKLTDFVKRQVGYKARGMWLAERVWEPQLARCLNEAGVEYTVLDDSHFKCTGLTEEETFGYFTTEDLGRPLQVFPISEKMRYTIPFQAPQATIDYLRSVATEDGTRVVVMADDGEKFGVWPDTHKHVYQDGWLESFFKALEDNSDWIKIIRFSDAIDTIAPIGKVYLPTASYMEMMEWAMPPSAIHTYEALIEDLKSRENFSRVKSFVRGGFWRSFFAKYAESNQIHKRMLGVSDKVQKALAQNSTNAALRAAQDHLWQGQCNCAYWHGVFGGLYLPHLRNALYKNLIEADTAIEKWRHKNSNWIEMSHFDFDVDGQEELIVETPVQNLYFKPSCGGAIVEYDYKPAALNLVDTLMRREEAYHVKVARAVVPGQKHSGETASIHDRVLAKEPGLEKLLHYDWHRRLFLLDHFLAPGTNLDAFSNVAYDEEGDFVDQPYGARAHNADGAVTVTLHREGRLHQRTGNRAVAVEKILRFNSKSRGFAAEYNVVNTSNRRLTTRFGVECNINLLAGNAHDRYYVVEGAQLAERHLASKGVCPGVKKFALVDEWMKVRAEFAVGVACELWRFPIECVSLSEAGFERVYQGSCMIMTWPLKLDPGETFTTSLNFALSGP